MNDNFVKLVCYSQTGFIYGDLCLVTKFGDISSSVCPQYWREFQVNIYEIQGDSKVEDKLLESMDYTIGDSISYGNAGQKCNSTT